MDSNFIKFHSANQIPPQSCSVIHDFLANELDTSTEETQQASTSVDWGNHSSGIDEYQKPVSANGSDDRLDEIMKGGYCVPTLLLLYVCIN